MRSLATSATTSHTCETKNDYIDTETGGFRENELRRYLLSDAGRLLNLQRLKNLLLELGLGFRGKLRVELAEVGGEESPQQHGGHAAHVLVHRRIVQRSEQERHFRLDRQTVVRFLKTRSCRLGL